VVWERLDLVGRVLELVLASAMIASALAFGGVQPIAYSLMEIVLFLVLLLALYTGTRPAASSRYAESRKGVAGGLRVSPWALPFVLWAVIGIIPLPVAWVVRLSPARALDPSLAAAHAATLSINAHDTAVMLMKFIAYLSAFVLAAYLFDSGKRKSLLLAALMALGIFEAAYGAVQYLTGWQKIFAYTKQYYTTEGTGTYINHNHFAGLLELALPFVVASVFYHFQLWSEGREAGRGRRIAGGSAGLRAFFYLFLAVIVVVGAICSKSRGGIVGIVFSVMLVAALAQLKTGQRVWLAGLVLFLVSVGAYGMWIGLGPLAERFQWIGQQGYMEHTDLRLPIWRDDLRLIHDYPLTGTGLGTFALGFRHYQTAGVALFFDHPHNDYLEVASDTGLVGVALLFLPIFVLLARMVGSFLSDSRRYRRAVILGCIGSVAALLVHSTTDFNLQIPANALVFAIVLGVGYKAAIIERRLERLPAATPIAVSVAEGRVYSTPTDRQRTRISN